jgi:hypothetical protein
VAEAVGRRRGAGDGAGRARVAAERYLEQGVAVEGVDDDGEDDVARDEPGDDKEAKDDVAGAREAGVLDALGQLSASAAARNDRRQLTERKMSTTSMRQRTTLPRWQKW